MSPDSGWKRSGWSPLPYPFEARLKARARQKTADLLRAAGLLEQDYERRAAVAPAAGRSDLSDVSGVARSEDEASQGTEQIITFAPVVELDRRSVFGLEAVIGGHPPADQALVRDNAAGTSSLWRQTLIESACGSASRWSKIFGDAAPLVLVPVTIGDAGAAALLIDVQRGLASTGLAPEQLCLLVDEADVTKHRGSPDLVNLGEAGVGLAVSEFQGGGAALQELSQLPIKIVFLSKEITNSMLDQDTAPSGVESLLSVARANECRVAASRADTDREVDRLREIGVGLAQVVQLAQPYDQDLTIDLIAEGLSRNLRIEVQRDDSASDR